MSGFCRPPTFERARSTTPGRGAGKMTPKRSRTELCYWIVWWRIVRFFLCHQIGHRRSLSSLNVTVSLLSFIRFLYLRLSPWSSWLDVQNVSSLCGFLVESEWFYSYPLCKTRCFSPTHPQMFKTYEVHEHGVVPMIKWWHYRSWWNLYKSRYVSTFCLSRQ